MQYSFPKGDRFASRGKTSSPDIFYNVPDTKTKKTCSFGFGNKLDLSKSSKVPTDPTNYNLKSDFEKDFKKNGITFGAGR